MFCVVQDSCVPRGPGLASGRPGSTTSGNLAVLVGPGERLSPGALAPTPVGPGEMCIPATGSSEPGLRVWEVCAPVLLCFPSGPCSGPRSGFFHLHSGPQPPVHPQPTQYSALGSLGSCFRNPTCPRLSPRIPDGKQHWKPARRSSASPPTSREA